MGAEAKTATFIRDVSAQNKARGEQRLYLVSPPMVAAKWDDSETTEYPYVIVSAVDVIFSGPETYIFPATPGGEIADWGELAGSFKGALDHEEALTNAGYTVADVLVVHESAPRKGVTS